jgi:hypothetical protein
MSERDSEQGPVQGSEPAAEPIATPAPEAQRPVAEPPKGSSRAALWLAGLLILVLAGVALSPFWAPQIAPLLPWGESRPEYAALESRLAAAEARPVVPSQELDAIQSAATSLANRVGQLETAISAQRAELEKRPAAPSVDLQPIDTALHALTQRVDHLEAAVKSGTQIEPTLAATRAELQQAEQRLAAIERQSALRVESETAAAKNTEQELASLHKADADLVQRVAVLERETQSQTATALRADGMLALLLAQMREAVEQARPFPTEFNAFVSLAQDQDLAAAARPLAEAAHNGAPSRAVLEKRLAELAGSLAATNQPADDADWGTQTLARLRSLVTIRRIDSAPQTGPEAAVSAARAALAGGDLAGAVAALDPAIGANADAVRPWLRMAHERLAVETALDHLQELLTARLGGSSVAPGAAPATVPEEPGKARTRS